MLPLSWGFRDHVSRRKCPEQRKRGAGPSASIAAGWGKKRSGRPLEGTAMRATKLFVLMAVAGLAAVACHSGGAKTSLGSIELAADRTTKAGTSRIAMTARVTGGGISSGPITETGTGVADYERNVASLQLTISGAGAGPQAIEFRIIDRILYEKPPAGSIPASKPWIKVDVSDLSGIPGGSSGPASFTGNPSQTLSVPEGRLQRCHRCRQGHDPGGKDEALPTDRRPSESSRPDART